MHNDIENTDPQRWLDYLDGKLSPEEGKKLEEEIGRSEFLRDALEGLRPIQGKVDLPNMLQQLNQQLSKQLSAQKTRRKKRSLPTQQWIWVSIVIILAVCLLGYYS